MRTNIKMSNFKFLAIVAFLGLFLQSCSSDDDSNSLNAPIITDFEYGEGNDHSTEQYVYKGSDIHLEAKIDAEAIVKSISLSIHAHDLEIGEDEVDWDFEKVYTDEKYLAINPTFHEHVDVPTNIPAGEYHIELVVTDEEGNSTEIEGHIDVKDPITLGEMSIDASVARGNDFHTEFMINAVNGIHSVSVDVHAHGLTLKDGEEEWDFEKEYLEKYHEKTEVEFHEHIDVPATAPAGEYHITFIIEDEEGITKEYETHIDITE